MKVISFKRIAVILLLLPILFFFSCQKESRRNTVSIDEAVTYSEAGMEAEAGFDDIQDISLTAADEEGVASTGRVFPFIALRLRIGDCAIITVTPQDSTYPKTVTIDFGTGCMGRDGRLRKGAIILHFTGPIRRPGSVLTISLRDYYAGRLHIEGTKTVSNISTNGTLRFSVQVTDGKVTLPDGKGYTHNALKYITQLQGGLTDDVSDDVFSIEGSSATTFNNGMLLTLATQTPLIKKTACNWISNGQLKITIADKILYLDYAAPGNGACDNKAMLTCNNGNNQHLITLQ